MSAATNTAPDLLTDEWIGAQIAGLPDEISFVSPYFAFARNVEKAVRAALAQQPATAAQPLIDAGELAQSISEIRSELAAGRVTDCDEMIVHLGERLAAAPAAAQPSKQAMRPVGYVLQYPHKDGTCHYGSHFMDKSEAQATAANSSGQAVAMPVYGAAPAAAQPEQQYRLVGWMTTEHKDGSQKLQEPFFATNPAYIAAHKYWQWQSVYVRAAAPAGEQQP